MMSLVGKSEAEISELERQLMDCVPEDGTAVGNGYVRDECLGWDPDLYLAIRNRLRDSGDLSLGRGRGGSIKRQVSQVVEIAPQTDEVEAVADDPFPDERSLYGPMLDVLRTRWVQDQPFDQYVVEDTSQGGRRADGVWTRPDLTVASMTTFTYVPGRHLEITTFEVKHYRGLDIKAVYEAMAQRRSATRAYVIAFIPDDMLERYNIEILPDLIDEAARHGIGVIIMGDPSDYDTWEIREVADSILPDPARMNSFIRNQLTEGTRDQIVRWFR